MSRLPMKSSAKWLLLCLTMFVSSCSTSTAVISPCSWVKIITVSKSDTLTDQTAREILEHNLSVERICGK